MQVHAVPDEQTKVSSIIPSLIFSGNDGGDEVSAAALHTPAADDRVDPGDKSFSGLSFFQQYCHVCKKGLYLYPCEDDAPVKFLRLPMDKSEDWLQRHGWERDDQGLWRLHVTVKHLRWLADGAGAVKQSCHVGHSHQRDLSVWCPILRDVRQTLRSSGKQRLRFGCYVGISGKVQNRLFKLCKTDADRKVLASLTGITGRNKWHSKEVSGDGGNWSDGLWHAFATGAKKLVALLTTLMRGYGLADIWQKHTHKCLGKVGGNWGYITHGTGLIQLCGCNGGKIRDLCCMPASELFRCDCEECVRALRKAGGTVRGGVAEFLPPKQFEQVKHLLHLFNELWLTCSTTDYDEFLRRRVFMRVQGASFNEHIALIFGPKHITPKFATMEYLLPQLAYALPPGIPLAFLTEQPVEAHHIVRKTDVTGASGPDPVSWRLARTRRVSIKSHKWLRDREPGGSLVKARQVLHMAKRIKVEEGAIKLGRTVNVDNSEVCIQSCVSACM